MIPVKGQTLYLLAWEHDSPIPIIKPMVVSSVAKLNQGKYSHEVYFYSEYNMSRPLVQLGITMFLTDEEATDKLKEWYKDNNMEMG